MERLSRKIWFTLAFNFYIIVVPINEVSGQSQVAKVTYTTTTFVGNGDDAQLDWTQLLPNAGGFLTETKQAPVQIFQQSQADWPHNELAPIFQQLLSQTMPTAQQAITFAQPQSFPQLGQQLHFYASSEVQERQQQGHNPSPTMKPRKETEVKPLLPTYIHSPMIKEGAGKSNATTACLECCNKNEKSPCKNGCCVGKPLLSEAVLKSSAG